MNSSFMHERHLIYVLMPHFLAQKAQAHKSAHKITSCWPMFNPHRNNYSSRQDRSVCDFCRLQTHNMNKSFLIVYTSVRTILSHLWLWQQLRGRYFTNNLCLPVVLNRLTTAVYSAYKTTKKRLKVRRWRHTPEQNASHLPQV